MIAKKTVKQVALGTTIGLGVGIVITVAYYTKGNPLILKEVTWTPQGDVLLTFYHRVNKILIPKPEI